VSTTATSMPISWIWCIVRNRYLSGSLPSYGMMAAAISFYFWVFLITMAGGYTIKFCNPSGTGKAFNVIVCVDKGWGEPGCRYYNGQFEQDWTDVVTIDPNTCYVSPVFYPTDVLTAVTSEGMYGYISDYVHVRILDETGTELVSCPSVYIDNPCYLRLVGAILTRTNLDIQQL